MLWKKKKTNRKNRDLGEFENNKVGRVDKEMERAGYRCKFLVDKFVGLEPDQCGHLISFIILNFSLLCVCALRARGS